MFLLVSANLKFKEADVLSVLFKVGAGK
ncbi:Protein of unknown function [Bacillus cytotoxicus]|nr:Protein of unknown function [Bacillus cytotoxicus]